MKTKVKKENKKEKKVTPCKRCEIKHQIDRISKLFDATCVLMDDIEKAENQEERNRIIQSCDQMIQHVEEHVGVLHSLVVMLPIPLK